MSSLDALAEDEEDDDADEDEGHVELLALRLQALRPRRRQLLLHPQRRVDPEGVRKEQGMMGGWVISGQRPNELHPSGWMEGN